jgi:hypothetical protein
MLLSKKFQEAAFSYAIKINTMEGGKKISNHQGWKNGPKIWTYSLT